MGLQGSPVRIERPSALLGDHEVPPRDERGLPKATAAPSGRPDSGARTVTSERKFDKYGDWHYVKSIALRAVWLATNHEALREYAQMYWYDDRA
jgi:hypothetical protein